MNVGLFSWISEVPGVDDRWRRAVEHAWTCLEVDGVLYIATDGRRLVIARYDPLPTGRDALWIGPPPTVIAL